MKRILIIGASGFIGKAMIQRYLQCGYEVIGIDLNEDSLTAFCENKNFSFIKNSDTSFNEILDIKEQIDFCFILAWKLGNYSSGNNIDDCLVQVDNIKLVLNAFDKSRKINCKKIITIGTSRQYMKYVNDDGSIMNKGYSNVYGICKRTVADLCKKIAIDNHMNYNNVLLSNIFGIGDYSDKAVNTLIKKFVNNEEIKLIKGDKKADWVYIDDVVMGILTVAEKGTNYNEYHIGHSDICLFKENLYNMRDALGSDQILQFGVFEENETIDYSEFSESLLYEETGFECENDFKESIVKTKDWLKLIGKI